MAYKPKYAQSKSAAGKSVVQKPEQQSEVRKEQKKMGRGMLVFFIILFFTGFRGDFLISPLMVMSMPIGVNTVVFPESCGEDATDNARVLFISYIMALLFLPLVFSLITKLAVL